MAHPETPASVDAMTAGEPASKGLETAAVADVEADRRERALARADRRDQWAGRRRAEAQREHDRAAAIADVIPLGQPILAGHHSQRRHERDLARIDRGMGAAAAAARMADHHEHRAETIRAREADRASGPGIERRLKRLDAEFRDLGRRLDGTSASVSGPASGDYRAQLLARQSDLIAQTAYWRQQLEDLIECGDYHTWGPADFGVGDRITTRHGGAIILRVNPRSLTVRLDLEPRFPGKLPYHRVLGREPGGEESGER